MKTKDKILALLEIAIVLCSVFLVALPGVAAEQTTQEVSGSRSASTITTASEDDYVLGVYGNANEDDTIDMRDLTYVKLIFFGKKPETELADAKYDGKINPLDFIQIKLIIVGKEKELTVVDSADRIVTVKKPIERVVTQSSYDTEAIRVFGAKDKIVGVGPIVKVRNVYFPKLTKLPLATDAEVILSLNPDLVIKWSRHAEELAKKLPGIPVVGLNFWIPADMREEVMKLGYIMGEKDKAEHYLNDFSDNYIDLVKAQTEGLSEEKRPKVYIESWSGDYKTYGGNSYAQGIIDVAGGRNIFADTKGGAIDPEAVMMRNPDIIIKYIRTGKENIGYGLDDPSKMKALRKEIMSRPELATVNAVKNNRVYITGTCLTTGLVQPTGIAYFAKWFQPDLFEDLDPRAIHQEYLTEFQGLDFDVSKHGIFVYHPELYPDGR